MYSDLKKEYQQYTELEPPTQKEREEDVSLDYRIAQIVRARGKISSCFENFMSPYVRLEEREILNSTLDELKNDLGDPVGNSLVTEDVSILNSSLIMFNKIKHLLRR